MQISIKTRPGEHERLEAAEAAWRRREPTIGRGIAGWARWILLRAADEVLQNAEDPRTTPDEVT